MPERRIILREEWGAAHERGAGPAPLPASEVWLHHSVTIAPDLLPPFDDDYAAVRVLERIGEQRFKRGISYTFAITPVGLIFEGHGVERRGAHTYGHNTVGRAICFVGNYEAHHPTDAMLDAAGWLLAHGYFRGWWRAARLQGGHRDVRGTSCPGRHAYAAMGRIDSLAGAYARGAAILPPTDPEEAEMDAAIRALFAAARSSQERRFDVLFDEPTAFLHWQGVAEKAGAKWREVLNGTLVKDLRREQPGRTIPDLPIA